MSRNPHASPALRRAALAAVDRAVHAFESRDGTERARSADATSPAVSSRRAFLQVSASSLAAGLLAACGSNGPDSAGRLLTFAGKQNEKVERWLFSHTAMNHGSPGAFVAKNQFPRYFISDTVPLWNVATRGEWALEVTGLVKTPLRLDLAALVAMPSTRQRVDHFCVEGWNAVAEFRGVRMREIAKLAGVLPQAAYVDFQSFDKNYHESWDMESAMHPQTLVVYGKEETMLSPAYGAPTRVHSPVKLGYKNTKYLTRIAFMAERNGGYWTDNGYDWYGGT